MNPQAYDPSVQTLPDFMESFTEAERIIKDMKNVRKLVVTDMFTGNSLTVSGTTDEICGALRFISFAEHDAPEFIKTDGDTVHCWLEFTRGCIRMGTNYTYVNEILEGEKTE